MVRSAVLAWLATAGVIVGPAAAAEPPKWLGDDLPLPLPVRTPQDIGFKAAAERQYLIFNLMAGGKVAYQRGDYATAVEKWETLLRIQGLDPQSEKAVTPVLVEAHPQVGPGGGHRGEKVEQAEPVLPSTERSTTREPRTRATPPAVRHAPPASQITVSGTVTGGG